MRLKLRILRPGLTEVICALSEFLSDGLTCIQVKEVNHYMTRDLIEDLLGHMLFVDT